MKQFHITEVISITTGKMVATSQIDAIYDVLEFMCGEPIQTHQIPRAIRECAPYLLKQFPMLQGEQAESVTQANLKEWALAMEQKYGKTLAVEPLPAGVHLQIDPITELENMKNPVKH